MGVTLQRPYRRTIHEEDRKELERSGIEVSAMAEKYRPKGNIVEAVQWFKAGDHPKVIRFSHTDGYQNDWHDAINVNGTMIPVRSGDYIVTESDGRTFSMSPEAFEKRYEKIEQ